MYFTADQIDQFCGFLLLNDFGVFVYCCKHCECECLSGPELEEHILLEHREDVKNNIKHIFVSDGVSGSTSDLAPTSTPAPSIEPSADSQEFEAAVELNNNLVTEEVLSPKNSNDGSVDYDSFEPQPQASCDLQESFNNNQKKSSPTKKFYCELCPDITFSQLCIVKRHMKVHMGNKVRKFCSICRKVTYDFEKHMKLKHTGRPYKCDFCDASFGNNSNRVIHMRMHTGSKPFLCATCGASFNSQSAKRKHELRMHIKKFPHQCLECNRTFLLPSHLQEHTLSLHSDSKNFICEACGKSFANRKHLRRHKLTHGERIHQCKCCDKVFKTTDTRRGHMKKVHGTV